MRKQSAIILSTVTLSISGSGSLALDAAEAEMCADSGIDMIARYYDCLEALDQQARTRYPHISRKTEGSLTLIADDGSILTIPTAGAEMQFRYFLVAHFAEHGLSLVNESGHEYHSRYLFNHANGQLIEIHDGWPTFSPTGQFVALTGGDVWDNRRMLAVYSLYNGNLSPTSVYHTRSYWFSGASFTSDTELVVTINCRVIANGLQVPENRTEQMTLTYDGDIWHPSPVQTCKDGLPEP